MKPFPRSLSKLSTVAASVLLARSASLASRNGLVQHRNPGNHPFQAGLRYR